MKNKDKSSQKKNTVSPEAPSAKRKKTKEELSEHGAMLQQIMDTASVAIGLVDKTGRITHANRSMAEMFGRTLEELAGCEYVELVHPSERETGRKNMLALLASEIPSVDLERRYWRKNGTEFWGHLACRRFHDVHGNELGLIGVITDITARKQSEAALKQSEAKYRLLYNETPVLLHSIDRNGTLVEVNDYWLKTLGYERNEVIGRKVTDFFTEASRKYAQEVVQPAFFRDGIAKDVSYQFVRKNGEVLDVLLSATAERDAAGAVVRSLSVIVDITERKRAEGKLVHAKNLMQYIISHAQSAIAVHDRDLKYIFVSDQYLHQYNVKEQDVIGKHHYDVFPDLPQKWRDVHQRVLAGAVESQEEDPYEREDGSVDWTRWECRPWHESDGSIGGLIVYTEVITDRKRREEALRASEERFKAITMTAS
ncbi:MAG TPA: PAS domain-containing protein, partial [Nitrospirota bacterium]|nr:PAS domain-containing protein [Nitrospirota bacterium]